MKKEYIQPQAKACTLKPLAILAGSVGTGDGYTSEQNAKVMNVGFIEDEDL